MSPCGSSQDLISPSAAVRPRIIIVPPELDSAITAALGRLKDAEQKTRFLGGVVRFTRDVAIVIQYLESLSASAPKAEAAATLVAASSLLAQPAEPPFIGVRVDQDRNTSWHVAETIAGVAYLIAIPAFFALLLPLGKARPGHAH